MQRIYCDGSSNNYGSAFCVIKKDKKKVKVFNERFSVYQIEYLGILEGLKQSDNNSVVFTDNSEIFLELNNLKKHKDTDYYFEAIELIKSKNLNVCWIPRNMNLAGIYLDHRLKAIDREIYKVVHPKIKRRKWLRY